MENKEISVLLKERLQDIEKKLKGRDFYLIKYVKEEVMMSYSDGYKDASDVARKIFYK
jgi:hypothetical protein